MTPHAEPARRPRLIACDLDGTVVRSDHTISERTVHALAAVEEAGSSLVFVTGRPPRWMRDVAERTGHRGLAICSNGALLYDLRDESVIDAQLIEPGALRHVMDALRRELPEVAFAVEYGQELLYETGYPPEADLDQSRVRRADPRELARRPAAKLLAHHGRLAADQLLARAREVAGRFATFTHSTSLSRDDGLLEISAVGVSKATALARLCERRGIDASQVVAFGDMPNDLPMLAWAGTAYAVANAHPEVRSAVALHAASNDEDGVARVLERLFRQEGSDA